MMTNDVQNFNTNTSGGAFDTSGNTYQAFIDKTNGRVTLAKYSTTGTKTFANYYNTSAGQSLARSMVVSGSTVAVATIQTNSFNNWGVAKFDTSGTLAYYKSYSNGNFNTSFPWNLYINASGDIYVTLSFGTQAGKATNLASGVGKINSAGTLQYMTQRAWSSGNGETYVRSVAEVGGFLYYYGADNTSSNGIVGHVLKVSAANGTTSYNSGLVNGVQPAGLDFRVNNGRYDTVNSVHYLAGQSNNDAILSQFPLALNTNNWLVKLANSGTSINFQSLNTDSSGNVYVTGYTGGNNNVVLVKYNSSGTLQWQRQITMTSSAGGVSTQYPIDINVLGTQLVLTTGIYASANTYYSAAFQYPTDGSKTGTFVNGLVTFTITASSYTASTPSKTTFNITTVLANAGTATVQTYAASPTTATNTLTVTTI